MSYGSQIQILFRDLVKYYSVLAFGGPQAISGSIAKTARIKAFGMKLKLSLPYSLK